MTPKCQSTTAVSCMVADGIAVISIDYPPVNALSAPVRRGLLESFRRCAQNDAVQAIVLACAGRTFCVGADLSELGKPLERPGVDEVFDLIENGSKPVVAAIHGTALGGGYEFALICHYRIAVPSARVGLPEVKLGLIPGGGGTQRLTRIVGVAAALELLTTGEHVPAPRALELGMIDALAGERQLLDDAIAFARRILHEGRPLQRIRDRPIAGAVVAGGVVAGGVSTGERDLYAEFLQKNAGAFRGELAPEAVVSAVRAAAESGNFDAGLKRERELIGQLWRSPQAAARNYYFSAEREASRVPDVPASTPTITIRTVGVAGSGALAADIAACCRDAGVLVMTAGADFSALALAELVVEAVEGPLPVKRDAMRQLDGICPMGAILATSSSTPMVDELAAAIPNPGRLLGLHFFAPANQNRLLEVVRGNRTSIEALATALKFARHIGKVPVLSRSVQGFIAARAMGPRNREALALLREGRTRTAINSAIYDFGFAAGPIRATDSDEPGDHNGDRNGNRNGDGAESDSASEHIVERLLYPVVNEGAKILEEGIALRASDIDVACILGCGWPVYTGGPMFWADAQGLPKIVARLKEFEAQYGVIFKPAALLERRAAAGRKLTGR